MADPTEVESDDHTESSVVKELRAKAKRVEQAEARLVEMERKLALTEAGLNNLSDKQVKALLSAHDGEITAEAIKATADELGFAGKVEAAETEVDPEQAVRDQEVAALAQFAGASRPDVKPDAYDAVVKGAKEFKGSQREYEQYLYANADMIAP